MYASDFGDEFVIMPLRVNLRLSDLIEEARRLGAAARPEILDWGEDVGAELIEDAYFVSPRGPSAPRR
jgi:antitoxin MazE